MEKDVLIEIAALWENEGKDGTYFSGSLNGAKLLVFKNKFKEKDSHPDWKVYVAPKKPKEQPAADTQDEEVPF